MADSLLTLSELVVNFNTDDGQVHAVRGVTLDVNSGEVLALVGESGSGKSVTALSILGLNPANRTAVTGEIRWRGEDLLSATGERIRAVRGAEISMVFQDPLTALNPVYTVGAQILEMIQVHQKISKTDGWAKAVEMLTLVGIPQPEQRAKMYPHEFSGGMRQRAMIAMALACSPELVIADEPTTALDVTVQAQVLDVLEARVREAGAALMLITHDLGVVAGIADRVAVMYAGLVVEVGTTDDVFTRPSHPYTQGLLASLPRLTDDGSADLVAIGGQPPSMLAPPSGCAFRTRCAHALSEAGCDSVIPPLVGGVHQVACHRSAELFGALDGSAPASPAHDAPAANASAAAISAVEPGALEENS